MTRLNPLPQLLAFGQQLVRGMVWMQVQRPLLLPLLIVLLAFATRFHALDAQSLWNDEGNSLHLAQRNTGDLLDAAGRDIHPPGYYLALKAWIGLTGTSEFSLRALSALEGVLAVAVTFALGRALFSSTAGYLAGLLVAVSPFAVYYSQETRMYAQLSLFSVASMWFFVMWLRALEDSRETKIWPLALVLSNTAGLYTHYAFPFTLLAQGVLFVVWLIWPRGRETQPLHRALISYLLLNALSLVLFLLWLPTAWDQVTTWPRTGVELALSEQLRTVLTWISYGNTAGTVTWLAFLWPGLLIGAACWPRRNISRLPGNRSYGWRVGLLLAWAGIVIGTLFLSGAYRAANLKFLLPAQIAVALLIGQGTRRLWHWSAEKKSRIPLLNNREVTTIARMLAAVCFFLVTTGQLNALDALYTDPAYARADYHAIAAQLMAESRPGDAIILDAPNQIEVFSVYYRGAAPLYELPRGLGGDDAQTRADVQAVIRDHQRIFVLFWGEEERDPQRVVQATLDAGAYPVTSTWFGDVRLAQYSVLDAAPATPTISLAAQFGPHITLSGYALSTDQLQPGEVMGVTLFWTTNATLTTRYKVTVQLLATHGSLVGQHDAEPGNNTAPTSTWKPGITVPDAHGVVVPPDLTPGTYTLIVSVYAIDAPLERLPVLVDGDAVGDVLVLSTFTYPPLVE